MLPEYIPQEATRLLGETIRPTQVILLSSCVRGDVDDVSDTDFLLVIEPGMREPGAEIIWLSQMLQPLGIATDMLVHSRLEVDKRRGLCSGAVYGAMRDRKVLYAAT